MDQDDPGPPAGRRLSRDIEIPKQFVHTGPRVFPIADSYFELFRTLAGLKPESSVLDVGCGWGRMALPLLDFLKPPGCYLGLDVNRDQVDWANENLAPLAGGFSFRWVDIQNPLYNPDGSLGTQQTTLPGPAGSYDLTVCCSVLTHIPLSEIEHYLREFHRVARPTGRIFISLFLIDDIAQRNIDRGLAKFNFVSVDDDHAVIDLRRPERGVAIREETWHRLVADAGLEPATPTRRGSWSGRASGLDGQDIEILSRRTDR